MISQKTSSQSTKPESEAGSLNRVRVLLVLTRQRKDVNFLRTWSYEPEYSAIADRLARMIDVVEDIVADDRIEKTAKILKILADAEL